MSPKSMRPQHRSMLLRNDVPKTEKAPCYSHGAFIYVGDDLLSHTLSRAVQSAQRGLTSVFGMGTGVSPAVRSPASQARAEYSPQLGPKRDSTQDLERQTLKNCPLDPGLKPRFIIGWSVLARLKAYSTQTNHPIMRGRSLTTE
jgi:hypothetical protein